MAIVNSVAINTGVHASFWINFSLCICLGVGSITNLILIATQEADIICFSDKEIGKPWGVRNFHGLPQICCTISFDESYVWPHALNLRSESLTQQLLKSHLLLVFCQSITTTVCQYLPSLFLFQWGHRYAYHTCYGREEHGDKISLVPVWARSTYEKLGEVIFMLFLSLKKFSTLAPEIVWSVYWLYVNLWKYPSIPQRVEEPPMALLLEHLNRFKTHCFKVLMKSLMLPWMAGSNFEKTEEKLIFKRNTD